MSGSASTLSAGVTGVVAATRATDSNVGPKSTRSWSCRAKISSGGPSICAVLRVAPDCTSTRRAMICT